MRLANLRRGLPLAALAAAAILAGCASNADAEAEAARMAEAAALAARTPPPVNLGQGVARDAAIYLAFSRDMAALRGGFENPAQIQAALSRGSAYEPGQISRGMVAYASIIALQSPAFVSGVSQYGVNPTGRQRMIEDIVADPRTASYLPGADVAAGLIIAAMADEMEGLAAAANSIENDAYAIQADGRRSWAIAPVADRDARLAATKSLSAQTMASSPAESARMFAAARNGSGIPLSGVPRPRQPPYPPLVTNALALAALAALGAAGDDAGAQTAVLQSEPVSSLCLAESKLNLHQCLAASRPSYEDMFCLGRHIVRDLGTCTRVGAMPAAVVSVSDLAPVAAPPAAVQPIVITPANPPAAPPARETNPAPAPRLELSPTERLNTGANTPE